jgi:hypothetical protein
MEKPTITELRIISRDATGNKAPRSGDVTFSDGKHYGYSVSPSGELMLFSHRKRLSSYEQFVVRSPIRSNAVKAALDAGEGKYVVIHVEF